MSGGAGINRQPGARGLVVFLIWQSLPYGARVVMSALLVLAGLGIQVVTGSFMPGVAPLAAGNLLLLVRGYDNRVDVSRFSPGADWQKVGREKLDALLELDKGIRSWDRSIVDVTNYLGAAAMIVTAAALGAAVLLLPGFGRVIALDAVVLLLPHWFTGIRRVLRLPEVVVRAQAFADVLDGAQNELADDQVEIMMLLKGEEVQVPDDIKFRISLAGQDEAFLGLYGQVVINTVQGRSYPYFYVVMVAREGYGLAAVAQEFQAPENMTKQFDTDAEVEFIVLRQKTTRTSGYHTKPADAAAIFAAGYDLARSAAGGG